MFAATEICELKLSPKVFFCSVCLRLRSFLKLGRCWRGKKEDNLKEVRAAYFLFLAFLNEILSLVIVKLCLER